MSASSISQEQSQASFNVGLRFTIFILTAILTVLFTVQHNVYDNFFGNFVVKAASIVGVYTVFSFALYGFVSMMSLTVNYLRRSNTASDSSSQKALTGLGIQIVLLTLALIGTVVAWFQNNVSAWLSVPLVAGALLTLISRTARIRDEDAKDALAVFSAMTDDPTELAKFRIELFRKEAEDGIRPHHPLLDTPIEQVTPEILAAYEQTPFHQQILAQQAAANAEMDAYYREQDLRDQEHEKRMQELNKPLYTKPSPFQKREGL